MYRDLTRLRHRIEEQFLPQTVEIMYSVPQTNDWGGVTRSLKSRVHHEGTSAIPARFDVSKHYRQAQIASQEVNVSEFDVHLPRSIRLTVNAQILLDNEWFEVRKVQDIQGWDLTMVALVVRVNSGNTVNQTLPDDALVLDDEGYLLGEDGRLLLE